MGKAFGGIGIAANATTQALTTTPAKLVNFSGGSGIDFPDSHSTYGTPAVKNDKANNRVLVIAPGTYKITFNGSMSGAAGGLFDFFIRKNAVVTTIGKRCTIDTVATDFSIVGLLTVSASDSPDTIAFSSATTPSLTGADMQPKLAVPIEVYCNISAATDTVTLRDAALIVEKIDP